MKFYVLTNPHGFGRLAVTDFSTAEPVRLGEAPKCPVCGKFIGMLPWLPPHRAELELWSGEFGDIAFGPGNELLVSERFAGVYRDWGLTGLTGFHDVEITRVLRRSGPRLRKPPPSYYCVGVCRSRAAVDVQASGLGLKAPWTCEECRSGFIVRSERVVVEEGTWSGEDVFFARGLPGTILTSEHFREFFEANEINNGVLVQAHKYAFDYYPEGGGESVARP